MSVLVKYKILELFIKFFDMFVNISTADGIYSSRYRESLMQPV